MVADKLFNSSLKLKVLVAVAMAAGLLVVVPSAQSQDSPVLSLTAPATQAPSAQSPQGQAQSTSDPCGLFTQPRVGSALFCLEKTASPNPVNVGEPLTFTIRAFCTQSTTGLCFAFDPIGVTDTLPPSVRFVSATASGLLPATCTESAGTVTCAPEAYDQSTPFVETITVIPNQCGTFTNTVNDSIQQSGLLVGGGPASVTFTVCPTTPPCPSAPATQEFSERRITSGAASPSERISNEGNNVNLSPTDQQAVQTGNVANEQGVVQSCSEAGDIDLTGSSITMSPSTTSESTQTIGQSAAAN